jgi:hypothetical protein
MLIGVTLILLGASWMIHDEPWMLDEVANIERLNMGNDIPIAKFENLFSIVGNKSLSGYLQQIYRFFGFWVIVIGLFLTTFSAPNFSKENIVANRLLWIVGFMISVGLWLSYALIPSSPFIFLTWLMAALYFLSLFAYIERIKNEK